MLQPGLAWERPLAWIRHKTHAELTQASSRILLESQAETLLFTKYYSNKELVSRGGPPPIHWTQKFDSEGSQLIPETP
jgi:hypothetical protein